MAHGYRTLHHFNQWLTEQFLGTSLLDTEKETLSQMLGRHFGKHALLIGVPEQYNLLTATTIPCHSLITPFVSKKHTFSYIEGDFKELPILTGSIDLVMLPHILEFIDHPRQLLTEACRIVKPEGLIAVCGFNPYSFWGIRKLFARHKAMPWSANFFDAQKIKSWLRLADFEMEKQQSILFRPPINHPSFYDKLHFLESVMPKSLPIFGGAYILIARAKVIPLTPIRLKWKQQLSNIRISTTITGTIARQSK